MFAAFLIPIFFSADVLAVERQSVGVSRIDVTPTYPVRLHGFGFRRTESEGVQQRIWVKGLVIGDKDPVVLLVADSLGVPRWMTDQVAAKLAAKHGINRERFCISATHTHTAPMLDGIAPAIFGMELPPEHKAHVERYTKEFAEALEKAADAALADRKPSTLSWGVGSLGFAANRRTKGGPVDHDLPAMFVKDEAGKVRAVLSSYACHCVTLSFNKISGDWAGCAAEAIETQFPGATALIAIGCGADANPSSGVTGGNWSAAEQQGREFAAEIARLSKNFLAPVPPTIVSECKKLTLPFVDLPTDDEWAKKAEKKDAVGHHARLHQNRKKAGKSLPTALDYEVCVWKFGDGLAMAFLPGEVVVDYSLRLKKELDGRRLWINAYSNDDPCYIPSERILKEGGYEGEFAMVYYDLPTKFKSGLENVIVDAVKSCAGGGFASPFDANKVQSQPKSAQQSQATIKVADDLAVDIVAAEPLLVDPVAIAFGPDGKLWVAEMNDYPSGKVGKEPGGRIRFLEDRDGDGNFDSSTTFLSGIPYPTGVTVWRDGVLVCAAPDILFARDTNGDGKADSVRKLFTGFATNNFQARVNSLEYGLDGWLYGSCGLLGGEIKNETGDVVKLRGRDFRCKPDEGIIEPAAGSSQQGRVRNDWGDWFGCDNTSLGWHYPLPIEALGRNPHVPSPVNVVRFPDAAASKIFAISNQQMFALSGPVGHATAACGIGIYRDQLIPNHYGDFFTCEPVHNAVHRMKLEPKGSTFVGRRAPGEENRSFLASTDAWFRPVQMKTGTDGAIWIVDMHRYVIEHPMWIPPEERPQHDLRAGSTMGRIYRVRPKHAVAKALPTSREDAPSIVERMQSTNGPVRDLAMQQQLWTGKKDVAKVLRQVADRATAAGRFQIMSLMDNLAAKEELRLWTKWQVAEERRLMVRALTDHDLDLWKAGWVSELFADDPDPRVRLQAAISLGEKRGDQAAERLVQLLLRPDSDEFLRAASLGSINADNVAKATEYALKAKAPPEILKPLVASAVGFGKESQLAFLMKPDDSTSLAEIAALEGLIQGMRRKGADRLAAVPELARAIDYCIIQASNSNAAPERRIACLRLFGWLKGTAVVESTALQNILKQKPPPAVKSAAIDAAGRIGTDSGFAAIIAEWKSLTPMQRRSAMDAMLPSPGGLRAMAAAVVSKNVPAEDVDASRREKLLLIGDLALREKLKAVVSPPQKNRESVLAAYKSVESHRGDAAKGKAVFAKQCAGCHRLDDAGYAVGPDLAMVALKPASYLLMEILDPSKNLDSRYVGYTVLLTDGRTLTGLMQGESDSSMTLHSQDGKKHELLRSDVERIAAQGKSLMPEGLEAHIPPADMADLLAYVKKRMPPAKSFLGNTPKVIALENGKYHLPARFAEVRGPTMTFAVPQYALEYWQSIEDFAVWEVDVAKAGTYLVDLEYGVPSQAAGNVMSLEGGAKPLVHTLASTGGWETYKTARIGEIELAAGRQRITVKPVGDKLKEALMDLRALTLTPK
jgi:putative membrane-bound dehydrogenase-like protein